MSNYENAPATRMLATNCAVCRRDLLDAKSVETGMGPDCRKKHGFNIDVSEQARAEANRIVHGVALDPSPQTALAAAAALQLLGFDKLAAILVKRNASIVITEEAGVLTVVAPYSECATVAFRNVPGRHWDHQAKANRFPAASRPQLWSALKSCYEGLAGYGPKGLFII